MDPVVVRREMRLFCVALPRRLLAECQLGDSPDGIGFALQATTFHVLARDLDSPHSPRKFLVGRYGVPHCEAHTAFRLYGLVDQRRS